LHLNLAPRSSRNRTIRRTIGDAIECVSNARQLECNLFGSARPLQHNDPFSAEGNNRPEQQPNHEGYTRHEHVVTRDSDASARDGNYVVRKQSFLPAENSGLTACSWIRVYAPFFAGLRSSFALSCCS
jgi:hypothetical protein